MILQQKKSQKNFGTYTCSSYSESNSGNIGGSSINKSKSMSLIQRALLTPAEVLRINRPYLLVMFAGVNPAMTKASDLSEWLFNRLLSLGNPDFCTKVRIIRETARMERKDTKVPLWDIDRQINKRETALKEQEILKKKERLEKAKKEQQRFGHKNPQIEYNKEKIKENIKAREEYEKIINGMLQNSYEKNYKN